jgi:proteic killer suppression protein
MSILTFKNKATEDINYGRISKESLKLLPRKLHRKAQIKLARVGAATSLQDRGQHSIRINNQYRVCFTWERENASDVEIIDYH